MVFAKTQTETPKPWPFLPLGLSFLPTLKVAKLTWMFGSVRVYQHPMIPLVGDVWLGVIGLLWVGS